MLQRIAAAITLIVLLSGSAVAGPFEDADELAAASFPNLAGGDGVPVDYAIAHMLLNLAAAENIARAASQRDALALKMPQV